MRPFASRRALRSGMRAECAICPALPAMHALDVTGRQAGFRSAGIRCYTS
jgi:hypothetical protein